MEPWWRKWADLIANVLAERWRDEQVRKAKDGKVGDDAPLTEIVDSESGEKTFEGD